MNEVLDDLKIALANIEERYYLIKRTAFVGDAIVVSSDTSATYERNFISRLNVKFDSYINSSGRTYNLTTDIEVLKPFIYNNENTESEIFKTYSNLKKNYTNEIATSLTTIPDFVFHLNEKNLEEENQKLIIEAKTSEILDNFHFSIDLFKLNIYVDKFNFQNAVFLIVNNDIDLVKKRLKFYLLNKYYMSTVNLEKIYFFIKKDFNSELEEIKLSDLLENLKGLNNVKPKIIRNK